MPTLVSKNYNAFKKKKDVQLFVRKIYRFLHANHTIEFKYLRAARGYMVPNKNPTTVELDIRDDHHPRGDIVSTLIHEVLHFVYQDASETWVRTMEPRIYRQLSPRQIAYMEMLLLRYM